MVKLLIALLVLAAFAVGAALVIGGRVPFLDNRPVAAVVPVPAPAPPLAPSTAPGAALVKPPVPAGGFVVRDAPPPAPTPPPVPPPDAPGGLEAAIQRLRAAKPDAPPNLPVPNLSPLDLGLPAPAPPELPPPPLPSPDRLLTGPDPAPSILAGPPPAPPPPAWTAVTSQGARWRAARDAGGPMLVIDMGGGRVATVRVDPAFTALAPDAASGRVDFLKQTILESFPPRASQFRFARDGSVAMLR